MLTRFALAAIGFYQRRLRHAGAFAVIVSLLVVLVLGAIEIVSVPLLLTAAGVTAAPLGPVLGLVALFIALGGGVIIALAALTMGAPFSSCRYTPSCSNYATIAYARYGIVWGSLLTAWRLARCAPWGGHGWDPVPDRKDGRPDPAGTPRQIPPDRKHRHGQLLPTKKSAN